MTDLTRWEMFSLFYGKQSVFIKHPPVIILCDYYPLVELVVKFIPVNVDLLYDHVNYNIKCHVMNSKATTSLNS